LLLDEADTVFGPKAKGDHEDVRGIINSGHSRGATVGRCVGDGANIQTVDFDVFCPVALAGKGLDALPDTLIARAVVFLMRRRRPDEVVEAFEEGDVDEDGALLRRRLAAWVHRHHGAIAAHRPVMPARIVDRPADVWRPLIRLADVIGGDWPERARAACVALQGAQDVVDTSIGVQLLADIRDVFEEIPANSEGHRNVHTETLVNKLTSIEGSDWGEWGRDRKPITATWLAKHLRPFDIRPKQVRVTDVTKKGYSDEQFGDAWARYHGAHVSSTPPVDETPESGETGLIRGVSPVSPVSPQEGPENNVPPVARHHGARFTRALLGAIPERWHAGHDAVLDPFAGEGHELIAWCERRGLAFTLNDLELWDHRDRRVGQADATDPASYPTDRRLIVTSPTYGNGVNDHFAPRDAERRDNTYRTWLGRDLHENNSGRYTVRHGGAKEERYWALHRQAVAIWAERGFDVLLNVKDFPVRGELYALADRWAELLEQYGYTVVDRINVPTPGIRYGSNTDTSLDHEVWICALRRNDTPPPTDEDYRRQLGITDDGVFEV
jgi:hypothetical protein